MNTEGAHGNRTATRWLC